MSQEEQNRAKFVAAYGKKGQEVFVSIYRQVLFQCGSLKGIADWAVDFLAAKDLETQENMMLRDVVPHLEAHKFPELGTTEMMVALTDFRRSEIAKTDIGQRYA